MLDSKCGLLSFFAVYSVFLFAQMTIGRYLTFVIIYLVLFISFCYYFCGSWCTRETFLSFFFDILFYYYLFMLCTRGIVLVATLTTFLKLVSS